MWRRCLVLLLLDAPAAAQGPGLAPLECFVDVSRLYGLDNASAKQLCTGAISLAPARCFLQAKQTGALTDYQSVQLCAGATSSEPVGCTARLLATSGLTTGTIVQYCAALPWPVVVAPISGSPACVEAAQATGLTDTQATDVCRGSTSIAPAICVARGRDLTGLADGDLVQLCSTIVPFPQPH